MFSNAQFAFPKFIVYRYNSSKLRELAFWLWISVIASFNAFQIFSAFNHTAKKRVVFEKNAAEKNHKRRSRIHCVTCEIIFRHLVS